MFKGKAPQSRCRPSLLCGFQGLGSCTGRRRHEFGADRIDDRLRHDPIDLELGAGVERPPEYLVDRLQLAGVARSPECRSRTPVEEPTHRQLDDPLAITLSGELIETPDSSEILQIARRLEFRVGQAKIVALEMRFFF